MTSKNNQIFDNFLQCNVKAFILLCLPVRSNHFMRMSLLNFQNPFVGNLTTVNFWGCSVRGMTDLFRDKHHIHYKASVIVCLSVRSNNFLKKSLLNFQHPFCLKLDHCELLRLLGKGNDRPVKGQQTPMSLQGLGHSLFVSKEQSFPGKVTFEFSAPPFFATWPLWTFEVAW